MLEIIAWIIIILFVWSIFTNRSDGKKQHEITNQRLEETGLDTETYSINRYGIKTGIDVNQRKVFQSGIEKGITAGETGLFNSKITVIDLTQVIDVEMIEDSQVTHQVSSGSTIARSAVGGVLAGGVGAIVGGGTAKSKSTSVIKDIRFRFRIDNVEIPFQEIQVFQNISGVERDDVLFQKDYKEILDLFGRIELVLGSIRKERN